MFDRASKSLWTQLEGYCIQGAEQGKKLKHIPFYETTWGKYKSSNSAFLLMTTNTGINRDYSIFPYGDYRIDHNSISYPLAYRDTRLLSKEYVFCVEIRGEAMAYALKDF